MHKVHVKQSSSSYETYEDDSDYTDNSELDFKERVPEEWTPEEEKLELDSTDYTDSKKRSVIESIARKAAS